MNNNTFNPYAILQIESNATPGFKRAYHALSKIYHPDKGGNPEMFRIITQAYRMICGESDNTTRGVREKDVDVSKRGDMNGDNFTIDKFNREFSNLSKKGVDFIYDVNHDLASNRKSKLFKRKGFSITRFS